MSSLMATLEKRLFINKYKPIFLDDYILDKNLLETLRILIRMNKLNLLFVGNNGCGKTSILHTIVREYYIDYSYNEYSNNILHINNLKEQGISYYRNDVKIFCQTRSSVPHKKKIVILDDIDIINEQSQQIFRNFIDKYHNNVHFISSCCSLQKVIESIQSRFTIIQIHSIQKNDLRKIMDDISTKENIIIEPDASEFIVNVCNNTSKVLINYMEHFKLLNRPITFMLANQICSNISFIIFTKYTEYVKNIMLNEAIQTILSIYDNGYSVMDILDNYFIFIKSCSLLKEEDIYKMTIIICKYINVFYNIHEDEVELSLFTNNIIDIYR